MRKTNPSEFTEATALAFFATHLDKLKWNYRYSKDEKTIYSGFNSPELLWDFSLCARERANGLYVLIVNSYIPIKALPERRAACVELLNRINFELLVGCFEMNLEEGHICFRTSAALPGADITPGIVEHLLRSNLDIVGIHYHQIAAVLYGGVTPKDALKPKDKKPAPAPASRFSMN